MNAFHAPRFPIAGHDVLDDATALQLLGAVIGDPPRCETVLVLLDADRRGRSIINVEATCDPDAVLDVGDLVVTVAASATDIDGAIMASVRPGGTGDLDDIERWLELDQRLDSAGIELVEWYVFGRSVSRPRELVGEPPRWVA